MAHREIQILAVLFATFTSFTYARPPQKIKGGEIPAKHEFPYQALLIGSESACSAVIIDSMNILTAAHCFYSHDGSFRPIESWKVITGSDDFKSASAENTFTVQNAIPHPEFGKIGITNYDIGIVKLRRRISFDHSQKPAALSRTANTAAGTEVMFTGWGIESNDDPPTWPSLRKFNLTVISRTECRAWLPNTIIDSDKICAWSERGATVCSGDSGGPLISNGIVIGIAAMSSCEADFPAIYTNIHYYRSWIRKTI